MSRPLPTLTQLLDIGEEHARLVLIKQKQPDLVPFYHFVVPGQDKDILMPCAFGSDSDKGLAVYMARVIAHDTNAVAVMFVSEAWMVALPAPPGTQASLDNAKAAFDAIDMPSPSKHPERVEVVNLVASDGIQTVARHLRMARNKRGKLVALHREKEDNVVEVGGRMIDGIIPIPTTH
jgi:hypothetical protein